jgi:hypothetical protein
MTIWQRQPSNFTSVDQSAPLGGLSTKVGIIGAMKSSQLEPGSGGVRTTQSLVRMAKPARTQTHVS